MKFYLEMAEHHGEMAVYYLDQQKAIDEGMPQWNDIHAVIEAREAFHYARLLTPDEIALALKERMEAFGGL